MEDNSDIFNDNSLSNQNDFESETLSVERGVTNMKIKSRSFLSEDFRKLPSDSTSIVSDSSEGYEYFTDSEVSCGEIKKRTKKFSTLETEYPKRLSQRSKSQMFKKRYAERVVVNEELGEDDNDLDSKVRRRPFDFNISFNGDLTSNFSKKFGMKNQKVSSSSKLYDLTQVNMDPVVEVKETEEIVRKGLSLLLHSPRVKYMTDFVEDSAIISPRLPTANNFHLHKDYVEMDEVIAEDNNENVVDFTDNKKRRDPYHKILMDGIIDKEEFLNLMELNINPDNSFEIIKEEYFEEDDKDVITHKKNSSFSGLPLTDEIEDNNKFTSNNFRITKYPEEENLIKEIDEEKEDK